MLACRFAFVILALSVSWTRLSGRLAEMWPDEARILVIGEQHTARAHGEQILHALPQLHARGMRHLALEIPRSFQGMLDQFVRDSCTADWLAAQLWSVPREQLPNAFELRLSAMVWARAHGVRLWAIDADDDLFWRVGTCHRIAEDSGRRAVYDPHGEQLLRQKGLHPAECSRSGEEAIARAWHLWINGRTQSMGAMVAQMATDFPTDRIVAVVGNAHADFGAFRDLFRGEEFPRYVRDDSIEEHLPTALRSFVHTVCLHGGALLRRDRLTAVERFVIQRGLGEKLVSIAQTVGFRSMDSAMFVPLRSEAPETAALGGAPLQE